MSKQVLHRLTELKIIETIKSTKEEYDSNPEMQSHTITNASNNNIVEYFLFVPKEPEEVDVLLKCKIAKELSIIRKIAAFFTSLVCLRILYYIFLYFGFIGNSF